MKSDRRPIVLCIAALFVSASFSTQAQVENYITGTEANALGAGHGLVYWKADCADPAFTTDRIAQAPPTGGVVSQPYYRVGCSLANRVLSKISRDANGRYYFLNGNGDVRQYNVNSGVTTTVGSADTPANVPHNAPTAVSGARVFFTENWGGAEFPYSKLFQVPHGMAFMAPKLVVDLGTAPVAEPVIRGVIAHPGDRVTYHSGFRFGGRLGQAVRAMMMVGGNLIPYWANTTISSTCTALTEHDGYLYWVEQSADQLTSSFRRAPVTDPMSSTLLHTRVLAQPHCVPWLATDGEFLYYFNWIPTGGASGTGNLMRKEIGAGSAVLIAGPFNNVYTRDLCVQGDHLFWIQTAMGSSSATVIRRLAVNAAAIQRDLWMTDLEIIQIVQDSANSVPLIAEKPTVARAFARLWYSSIGERQITSPALNVILEGTRGGSPLPGSPLVAHQTGPILLNPSTRLDPDNRQFLFYLPPEWTAPGTITLTARVNPWRAIDEIDYGNNAVSETVLFENRACVGISIYPLRHTHGTQQGAEGRTYSPRYQGTLDRAEALLPTPRMAVRFEGGSPLEEYEWDTASYGPYELSRDDDDSWKVLFKLNGRYAWHHLSPPWCADQNFCAALFNTFPRRAFNGIACWGAFICYLDTTFAGINNPRSGITFAHELGHNFGRGHVNFPVGDPDPPIDRAYPYPTSQFGATNNHMGYDPLTRTFFCWDEAADLMSYGHRASPAMPRWTSAHTWNAIRGELSLYSSASVSREPMKPPAPQWFTGGIIYPDGHAEFEQTFEVEGDAVAIIAARLLGTESTDYEVRGYDADEKILFAVAAGVWQLHDAAGLGYVFAALLPPSPTARRLDLARIDPPGVLGTRTAGHGAPVVQITRPIGGSFAAGDPLVIEWKAYDPDDDPLIYQVRFSSDDGNEWKVIGDGLYETFLTVDHGPLAGGATCRVEVRASDGIHSGVDVSEPFALPESAPQAWIFFDTASGRRSDWLDTVYSPVGREVIARAVGYDAEDGPLPPGAFSWNVSGPEAFSGVGDRLRMANLAPGTYHVGLTAEDSSLAAASTSTRLIVDPKFIAQTGAPIRMDGRSLDAAYATDSYPVSLRYDDARVAQLHAVYAAGALHFSVGNLPNGSHSLERLVMYFDFSNPSPASRERAPQSDQYRLRVQPSGDIRLAQGNGVGYTALDGYAGIEARVWRGVEAWSVEVKLPDSLTGGYVGQTIGLGFGHENRTSTVDNTYWPPSLHSLTPGTWAPCVLGVYAGDPTDLDGDGLPDQWEREKLKGMSFGWDDDPDKDGMTNGEEWIAGTDPLDPLSRFVILNVECAEDGSVWIEWPSNPGRTYALWRSVDRGAFSPIAERIGATPPINRHADLDPPDGTAWYIVSVAYGR